ncbi:MAG: hypothetical protein LR015_00455 [Verrucomicrobia bacterium]|nr:hypothetical protein [Verrucomicrobiota bacterium]
MGFSVPNDVGIAVPSTYAGYRNSGIDQDYPSMGREAVSLLLDKLLPTGSLGVPLQPLNVVVPPRWNAGLFLKN